MPRPEVVIRMAKNDDGDRIAELMEKVGFFQWENWRIDWHDIEPNWIAAEIDGDVVGVIQVVPAKPIGRIECLTVEPDLSLMMKYRVVKMLTSHAVATVKMYGAQVVSSMIPWRYEDYLHGALNRGWIEFDSGAMVGKRLMQ